MPGRHAIVVVVAAVIVGSAGMQSEGDKGTEHCHGPVDGDEPTGAIKVVHSASPRPVGTPIPPSLRVGITGTSPRRTLRL
jgi:hypothetical protein